MGFILLTINLWVKKGPTIFVPFMSWDIPQFNKEISLRITF